MIKFEDYILKNYSKKDNNERLELFYKLNIKETKELMNKNLFKICKGNTYIGEIGYDIVGQLNEFKLVDLKIIMNTSDYQIIIKEFVNYLITKCDVLKIICNAYENETLLIASLLNIGFELQSATLTPAGNLFTYKITKRSFKYE